MNQARNGRKAWPSSGPCPPASWQGELRGKTFPAFLEEVEPQLARRLEATPYVCGDAFTAADCIIGYNVFWARGYGLCQDEAFRRYLKSLRMRPALAAALADAREFSPVVPDDAPIMSKFTG